MKADEIKEGKRYFAKVNGALTIVRVDRIVTIPGRYNHGTLRMMPDKTHYAVTNIRTNRKTTFRSAAKFRSPAADMNVAAFGGAPAAPKTGCEFCNPAPPTDPHTNRPKGVAFTCPYCAAVYAP